MTLAFLHFEGLVLGVSRLEAFLWSSEFRALAFLWLAYHLWIMGTSLGNCPGAWFAISFVA